MQLMAKFLHALNIKAQCRSLNVGLWSCPQFLFLIMGIIIIAVIIITFIIGQQYADVEVVTLIIIFVTAFLFIISFIIVRAFEQVVESRVLESKQAQEILKLKDQFVFIAAHELRTPANAIKWGLSSLRLEQPELAKKSADLLSIIDHGNDRLLQLVGDMLEVARIENHSIVIKLEKVSIAKLVPQVKEKIQPIANKQGVTVDFSLPDDMPLVLGDVTRLTEVLLGLLTSTVSHSDKGDILTVSHEVTETQVTIHVKAESIVFSEEEKEYMFEKFPKSSTAHNPDDTGLGLFITKQLIELMQGSISCTSHQESGTVFSFSLQRAISKENPGKP